MRIGSEFESKFVCAVPACKHKQGDNVKFFTFPTLEKDRETFRQWLQAVDNTSITEENYQKYYVCSNHFDQNLIHWSRHLEKSTVPTRNLDIHLHSSLEPKMEDTSIVTSRAHRAEVRTRKRVVAEILQSVPDYVKRIKCDTSDLTLPFKCAVVSCKNVFIKTDPDAPYKFHNFPKSPEMCEKWLRQCRLKDDFNTSFAKVCSDHFVLDDYQRNFREEMTNPNFKRKLKTEAFPTQLLTGVEVTIVNLDVCQEKDASDSVPNVIFKQVLDDNKCLFDDLKKLSSKKSELLKQINYLDRATLLKKRDIASMSRRVAYFDKSFAILDTSMLSRVFSSSQIKVLKGRNERVVWSDEDMAKAFTLRHLGGRECYLYLKDTIKFPLPSLSSVQKWTTAPELNK